MRPDMACARTAFARSANDFGQEGQPDECQRRGDQCPVKCVGAREQRDHRAIAGEQERRPSAPSRLRTEAQPNSDRISSASGERVGQADAEGHLGDALERELQTQHRRPAWRGRVARPHDLRYPMGVKRHVDSEHGYDRAPKPAASRQRFSSSASPPIARIIGSASSRIISAAPPASTAGHASLRPMDRDHQREQQRRPAFMEQAGHAAAACRRARPRPGTWKAASKRKWKDGLQPDPPGQHQSQRTAARLTTIIVRSPNAA